MDNKSDLEKAMMLVCKNYLEQIDYSVDYSKSAPNILALFQLSTSLQHAIKDISKVLDSFVDTQNTDFNAEELAQLYENGLLAVVDSINIATIAYGMINHKLKEE